MPAFAPDPSPRGSRSSGGVLERVLGAFSLLTMALTVPQVLTIWIGHNAAGVSLVSWAAYLLSAGLWLVHGVRTADKTIYVPCLGWILLDLAIVVGVIRYS